MMNRLPHFNTYATGLMIFVIANVVAVPLLPGAALADEVTERGRYLVTVAGCNDCHTPGYFLGQPDFNRRLGGSDVGFEVPGLGTFVGSNLTSDPETGIGKWSEEDIVKALRTGTTPEGRELAPPMPWRAFATMTSSDLHAIASYLKTLPPIENKVPGPFGPNEKPTVAVLKVVAPDAK